MAEREREPPDAFTLQEHASSTGRELSIAWSVPLSQDPRPSSDEGLRSSGSGGRGAYILRGRFGTAHFTHMLSANILSPTGAVSCRMGSNSPTADYRPRPLHDATTRKLETSHIRRTGDVHLIRMQVGGAAVPDWQVPQYVSSVPRTPQRGGAQAQWARVRIAQA